MKIFTYGTSHPVTRGLRVAEILRGRKKNVHLQVEPGFKWLYIKLGMYTSLRLALHISHGLVPHMYVAPLKRCPPRPRLRPPQT